MAAGDDRDNVIHVDFAGGGRRAPAVEAVAEPAAEARKRPASHSVAPAEDAERREDPLAALYTCGEVSRLFGLTASRLRYWDRSGFIQPSGQAGARRFYTFQDLISIRAAKGLLDRGVQLRRVRRSVEALRISLPRVIRPLAELRVVADGQTVVVRGDEGTYEPATGQLVLDFEVRTLRDDVVRVLRRGARSDADRRAAYEQYLEGCRLDEEESTFDRAEQSYRRAIELDPSLANAVTNLGNLRFRRGFPEEAEKLYRQALEIDATQPEAYYNLGFLCYERGDAESAIIWFRRALDHDPSFADAHFNLAMALEELTRVREAKPHWETYLRLDPSGPWAEIARRHLE